MNQSVDNRSDSLEPTRTDHLASALRVALSSVPFAGSLLVELVGTVIPDQRIDRIARFARQLEAKFRELEQEVVRAQLDDQGARELFEEGMHQAARATSDERLGYIASVIANGLADDQIEHVESRHLLRILGELNDVEIIWLRSYAVPTNTGDEAFRDKHKRVLDLAETWVGAPREKLDKAALQRSYKDHMVQCDLLEPRHEIDRKTGLPVFNRTGTMKIVGYELTQLGELLLRHAGMSWDEDD